MNEAQEKAALDAVRHTMETDWHNLPDETVYALLVRRVAEVVDGKHTAPDESEQAGLVGDDFGF